LDGSSDTLRNYLFQHYETRRLMAQDVFRKAGAELMTLTPEEDYGRTLRMFFERRKRR
jgi:hypothetical protein